MRYKGNIKNFEHLVISDPHYSKEVSCRYDRELKNKQNWSVELIINNVDEISNYKGEDLNIKGIEFTILLKNKNARIDLLDTSTIKYEKSIKLSEIEIGIDTAQISMGVNEKAKEINDFVLEKNNAKGLEVLDDYNPYFSLKTGADGLFGHVKEGIKNKEIQFIIVNGFFDDWSEVDEVNKLVSYLEQQFDIEELQKEKEYLKILYKEVGKKPRIMEIEDTLEAKQKLVGGLIEVVQYKENMILICNEEGKLENLSPNILFDNDYIAGDFFIVGDDYNNSDFKSLDNKQIIEAKKDLIAKSIEYKEIDNTQEMEV